MKIFKKLLLIGTVASVPVMANVNSAIAADVFNDVCSKRPNATVCKDKKIDPNVPEKDQNPIFGTNGVITKIVNLITIIVGIAAVITIILAGIKFITSGNNPQEVTVAREMIIYAIVAVVIAALAQAIVRLFLNRIFGLD